MGFFGNLFKSEDKYVSSVLDRADEAYTKACQTKNAAGLDEYFTRACLSKMLEKIRVGEKAYMGLERYKHVEWQKINDMQYIKHVTYDNVQISKGISASVGEGYDERWTLVVENGITKVSELRRCA